MGGMSPTYGNANGTAGGFGSGKDEKQNGRSSFDFGRFDWRKGDMILTKKAGQESNSNDYDKENIEPRKENEQPAPKKAFNPPLGMARWVKDPLTGKMTLDELKR